MTDTWQNLGGEHIWLPYTQMKNASEPLLAVSTQGNRIKLVDGRELVDGVASWWTACHGYNHPHIMTAMHRQIDTMPHVMFGGINHEPALRLAKRLAALTPGDLDRVFFVDSGSVAIETAMKMAVQYWLHKDKTKRTKFISFRNGYHGDTMGCMALCDPAIGLYDNFSDYAPHQILADLPATPESTQNFVRILKQHSRQTAAVVIEPLVQGVGGMNFHDPETLQRVSRLCADANTLLIADEIFTGFGRTGTMFACEHAGIVPDIMCLGKALTACTVTMAAVIARNHVFEAFLSDDPKKAFMHGPTYMANPIACAAANASLDLFQSEPRLAEAKTMEETLRHGLEPCRKLAHVIDVRVLGGIGVVQLAHGIDHKVLRQNFIRRGVWIRSWGDHIYLTPSLNMNKGDLKILTDAMCAEVGHLNQAAAAALVSVSNL
jgi:adenosylmethionine-8-amino-7-oxononanoate aminotransferase